MTEQEWLTCTDPQAMLNFLRDKTSNRKRRLFACACCRRIWHLLANNFSRRAVELSEQAADGLITDAHIEDEWEAWTDSDDCRVDGGDGMVAALAATDVSARWDLDEAQLYAISAATGVHDVEFVDPLNPAIAIEREAQSNLMRCIMGNPLRPVPLEPAVLAWNDHTIPKLAQAIYDDRSFDRLPILADALEEAGCTNADMLNHCRQPGEHVRGCWVVDLLLNKS